MAPPAERYSEVTGRFSATERAYTTGKKPAPLPEESDSDDESKNGSAGEDEVDDSYEVVEAAKLLLALAAVEDDDDALDEGQKWHVGQDVSQPLSFLVPSDANGGTKVHTFTGVHYDMNDPARVDRANKSRLQKIRRAKTELGLPLARPSMVGREFTQVNDAFLQQAHANYAAANDGKAIPLGDLVRAYQAQFPGENRTYASITTHMARRPALKTMRSGYTG